MKSLKVSMIDSVGNMNAMNESNSMGHFTQTYKGQSNGDAK